MLLFDCFPVKKNGLEIFCLIFLKHAFIEIYDTLKIINNLQTSLYTTFSLQKLT